MWTKLDSGNKIKFKKTQCKKITPRYIKRKNHPRYGFPKYVEFSKIMLDRGLEVYVYESKCSVSKYVYVLNAGDFIKIRFSQHRAVRKDHHFNVGPGGITTKKLIEEVKDLLY